MIPKPTLDFTPSLPVNVKNRVSLYGTIGLMLTAAIMTAVTVANAGEVRNVPGRQLFVTLQPPTVSGIRQAPRGYEYYRQSNPAVYPNARVIHSASIAPPNACGPNKFEVVNRRGNEPRCVGH